MQCLVQELGPSDVDLLMALEALCFDYNWTREQFLLGLERNAYRVLGIKKDGFLAGYIAFSLIEDEMEILNLAVHPDYRKQRFGTHLMEKAFEICIQNGIAKSFLDVKESNAAAIRLYEKFGYNRIGVRKRYYPDTKEDALLYRFDFDK